MPAFSGKYYNSMDEKGRLIIPAQFREIISANYSPKLHIVNGAFDRCLQIYPHEEWLKIEQAVRSSTKRDKALIYFIRRVIASAVEVEVDKQGRVQVPASHREDAGLKGEVAVVGQVEKVELWDRAEWDRVTDPSNVDMDVYMESLSERGLC